jgi:hypothetical protein
MKRSLVLAAALFALTGCSVKAPAPAGYLGYVFAIYHGKVLLAGGIHDLGLSHDACVAEVTQAIAAAKADVQAKGAPADLHFVGTCYPIPADVDNVIAQRGPAPSQSAPAPDTTL